MITGVLEAEHERDLARILRERGYFLVSWKEDSGARKGAGLSFLKGVSLKDKMFFTRNLQMMISAGLSLTRAIEILSVQTGSARFQEVLESVHRDIVKGTPFSQALSSYPDIFSELFVSMIGIGEESGNLEEVLKILTRQMEREYELKSKIQGALLYPIVIIGAMLGIGILMIVMIVPSLAETFRDLGVDLPPATQFIIAFGEALTSQWYLFVGGIAALGGAFLMMKRRGVKGRTFDALVLKLPVVGPLVKQLNSSYTARTLSSLILAGVPLVRALEIAEGTVSNVFFKEAIRDAREEVKKGKKMSEVFQRYTHLYSPLMVQMIEVGEATGSTSEMLVKLADFLEEEVTSTTENMSSIIEPILMVLIGAAVGFFAISMIQPMYSMIGAIE